MKNSLLYVWSLLTSSSPILPLSDALLQINKRGLQVLGFAIIFKYDLKNQCVLDEYEFTAIQ